MAKHAIVTGATGFLGKALTATLLQQGWYVKALGRNEAALKALEKSGAEAIRCDMNQASRLRELCRGCDVVFHSAAYCSPWGDKEMFYLNNVLGTRNVVEGCKKAGVGRLVHISSPSIYFNGRGGLGVREDAPLPSRPANNYAWSKLLAEREVDACNDLYSVTLRPRAIIGPGDTSIMPRLITSLESGRLRIVGNDQVQADFTYVDNVADAALLAAEVDGISGQKYNVTNGEPVLLWDMIRLLANRLELTMPTKRIPYPVAYAVGALYELASNLTPGRPEPSLSRYAVSVLGASATLDISAATKDLGYIPRIGNVEGLERYLDWRRWRR